MASLCFQIDGEWLTDFARTRFWDENAPYEDCEKLLLSCLGTDKISDMEKKHICADIIEGRKKLVGINEFTLEDDNENVRPISKKLEELSLKNKLLELVNQMAYRMIDFVDPYSAVKSVSKAKNELNVTSLEQCKTYFWYGDYAIDFTYLRPVEPGEGLIGYDITEGDTMGGLWLYEYPDVVYQALQSKDDFWDAVYEVIKDDPRFVSRDFRLRNEKYEAACRLNLNIDEPSTVSFIARKKKLTDNEKAVLEFVEDWLSKHDEPSPDADDEVIVKYHGISFINFVLHESMTHFDSERMYQILPDDYDCWEGLIAPNGDFYSCDFGGHNPKAYQLICCYPEMFPNIDYSNLGCSCSDALDLLLEQGWCATRYLAGRSYIDVPRTISGKCTKAQKDAIFDTKMKHDVDVDLSVIGY